MYWYDFIFCFLALYLSTLFYYSILGSNPYTSELYIGKKGAGKSLTMAHLVKKYTKMGWKVFCNQKFSGTYYIDNNDIGFVKIPEDSVLLIDEAGILWNNRKFKNLAMAVIAYMKYTRHYRVKMVLFSQSNHEIDVSFMRICDKLILVRNVFKSICILRYLTFKQVLIPASETAEARITDDLVPVSIFLGGIKMFWMPQYWDYYDSYDQPLDLREQEFEFTPYPLGCKPYVKEKKVKHKKNYLKKLANLISSKLSLLKTMIKRGKYL